MRIAIVLLLCVLPTFLITSSADTIFQRQKQLLFERFDQIRSKLSYGDKISKVALLSTAEAVVKRNNPSPERFQAFLGTIDYAYFDHLFGHYQHLPRFSVQQYPLIKSRLNDLYLTPEFVDELDARLNPNRFDKPRVGRIKRSNTFVCPDYLTYDICRYLPMHSAAGLIPSYNDLVSAVPYADNASHLAASCDGTNAWNYYLEDHKCIGLVSHSLVERFVTSETCIAPPGCAAPLETFKRVSYDTTVGSVMNKDSSHSMCYPNLESLAAVSSPYPPLPHLRFCGSGLPERYSRSIIDGLGEFVTVFDRVHLGRASPFLRTPSGKIYFVPPVCISLQQFYRDPANNDTDTDLSPSVRVTDGYPYSSAVIEQCNNLLEVSPSTLVGDMIPVEVLDAVDNARYYTINGTSDAICYTYNFPPFSRVFSIDLHRCSPPFPGKKILRVSKHFFDPIVEVITDTIPGFICDVVTFVLSRVLGLIMAVFRTYAYRLGTAVFAYVPQTMLVVLFKYVCAYNLLRLKFDRLPVLVLMAACYIMTSTTFAVALEFQHSTYMAVPKPPNARDHRGDALFDIDNIETCGFSETSNFLHLVPGVSVYHDQYNNTLTICDYSFVAKRSINCVMSYNFDSVFLHASKELLTLRSQSTDHLSPVDMGVIVDKLVRMGKLVRVCKLYRRDTSCYVEYPAVFDGAPVLTSLKDAVELKRDAVLRFFKDRRSPFHHLMNDTAPPVSTSVVPITIPLRRSKRTPGFESGDPNDLLIYDLMLNLGVYKVRLGVSSLTHTTQPLRNYPVVETYYVVFSTHSGDRYYGIQVHEVPQKEFNMIIPALVLDRDRFKRSRA